MSTVSKFFDKITSFSTAFHGAFSLTTRDAKSENDLVIFAFKSIVIAAQNNDHRAIDLVEFLTQTLERILRCIKAAAKLQFKSERLTKFHNIPAQNMQEENSK